GVAEVTQQLADDRRLGERREAVPALGVETVDGLDQAERGDLHEVVERLVAAAIAACERARERQVLGDQRLAGPLIPLAHAHRERPRAQHVRRRASPAQKLKLRRAPRSVPYGLRRTRSLAPAI